MSAMKTYYVFIRYSCLQVSVMVNDTETMI